MYKQQYKNRGSISKWHQLRRLWMQAAHHPAVSHQHAGQPAPGRDHEEAGDTDVSQRQSMLSPSLLSVCLMVYGVALLLYPSAGLIEAAPTYNITPYTAGSLQMHGAGSPRRGCAMSQQCACLRLSNVWSVPFSNMSLDHNK